MCTIQYMIPWELLLARSTSPPMPTTAYDGKLQRCPNATVGASHDDIFGQTIQPALNHIGYTPVAHSCAKETSQLGTGELWCNRKAEICAFTGPDPLLRKVLGILWIEYLGGVMHTVA